MADTGTLQSDPLFLGLTRPPMLFGVSFKFVLLNAFATVITFIQTSNFMAFVLMFVLHGVGYLICFKEPLFIELYTIKFQKCNKCRNKMYYGYTNSYDVY